jgi:ferredoxin/coenzyme F420-reducing hydrogenase delta subunit
VFLHIAVPLMLLAGMWLHIQRITRPVTQPARAVSLSMLAVLLVCAGVAPAVSLAPADLTRAPLSLGIDWLYLFFVPLVNVAPARELWVGAGVMLLALSALPWLGAAPRPIVAKVDPANCNGCRRCFADCPYEAIVMTPHSRRAHREEAVVREDLCVSCGICAGACPSSTPFRSIAELVSGIDMPQRPIGALREALAAALERLTGPARVVVFACERGARLTAAGETGIAAIDLLCASQVPPSFVEYATRNGAAGVVIASCPDGDCEYRLGARWTKERLAGRREPHLRANVPGGRVRMIEASAGEDALLARAVQAFRVELANRESVAEAARA